jgi:hypothetical protein
MAEVESNRTFTESVAIDDKHQSRGSRELEIVYLAPFLRDYCHLRTMTILIDIRVPSHSAAHPMMDVQVKLMDQHSMFKFGVRSLKP